MLALLALSSGLLLILPESGEESYALDTETEAVSGRGSEFGAAPDDGQMASPLSTPTSLTKVAGETGVVSEADTARLALATEAALVGADPNLVGGAMALSLADEMALAEQAMAALSPNAAPSTSTTQAPTTAAPATTAAPITQAPATTVASSSEAPAAIETTVSDAADGETLASETTAPEAGVAEGPAPAPETTDSEITGSETTVPETTAPETTGSETTVPETTVPETTVPETTTPETSANEGWVDTGNGVMVPAVLIEIRWCESRGDYTAANPSSSARGGYQFLTGSWKAYGHKDRYGVAQAHLATPTQQDEAALITWERDGTRPWNASKSCWSKRI